MKEVHDTGNGHLHEEEQYTLSLLRAQNTFAFGLPRTCSKETRGFSLPQILT
jgi:hypothetical protein